MHIAPTLALLAAPLLAQQDRRDVNTGWVIPDEGYCDQPLVTRLDDGSWLAVLTTGAGHEGSDGQHVISMRSTDQGRSWSEPVEIEPAGGPVASWAQPLSIGGLERVFVFYIYNDSGITDRRADLLGSFVYRWSLDGGRTWSKRVRIPMRKAAIDRENDFGGEVLMQWGVSQPVLHQNAVLVPFTKIGEYLVERTEAWFLYSSDLATLDDPSEATWELLPEGDVGIQAAGPISSEPCLAKLSRDSFACVVRTVDGHPLLAVTQDGGRTWSDPTPVLDTHGRVVRHPRACVRLWQYGGTGSGRYLLWTHENSTPTWAPGTRNPAWIRGGTLVDGELRFGPPEVLLYDPDPDVRISYPDLVLDGDRAFVLETQKSIARTHEVDLRLLESLFDVEPRGREDTPGLVAQGGAGARLLPAGNLRGGWSFEGQVQVPASRRTLLASARADGFGLELSTTPELALSLTLQAGDRRKVLTSQPGALKPDTPQDIAVVLDLGPGVIRWMVEGQVLDGGEWAPRGWARANVLAPGWVDEKLLVERDEQRSIQVGGGDRFRLGPPEAPNGLLVHIGEAASLEHSFGRVSRLGFVTTAVGFQPSKDLAQPAQGTVRLHFADGTEQELDWELRDSNGAGRGSAAQVAGPPWSLVRTSDGTRWAGRSLFWQSVSVDETRELVGVTFDTTVAVDSSGEDADFAVLALSSVPASAPSAAPLVPIAIPAKSWNADLLATGPLDGDGRGFREASQPSPIVHGSIQALSRTPLQLGAAVLVGAHYSRALLASEVMAIMR